MSRWRAIVIGAVTSGVLALAAGGCGAGQLAASGSGTPAPSRPATASPSASGSASVRASSAAAVSLQSSAAVPFTGDAVTLTVQAAAAPGSQQALRLATATLALGDGTTATVAGRCAGASLPPPNAGLLVRHVYRQAGVVSPHVIAATLCGQAGSVAGSGLAGASATLRVLPAAPADSASWAQCSRAQMSISATSTGAGLGHLGVLFALRNTSAASCRMFGYPGLQLLGSGGQALPTTVVRAVSGAYLFPAVVPHWVAVPPGAVASFDLQYEDNPSGAAASEPYATACPAATHVEVTLPNAYDHSVVPVTMAPCEGQVMVSPVVPGAQWLAP